MLTFLTILVFQISVENHQGMAQFDEQFRLIEAPDLETAWERPGISGLRNRTSF